MTGVPDRWGVGQRGESWVTSWFWPEHQGGGDTVTRPAQEYSWGLDGKKRCRLDVQVEVQRTPVYTALELRGEVLAGGVRF